MPAITLSDKQESEKNLCVMCGLCCNGTIFPDARVGPGEATPDLTRRGVTFITREGKADSGSELYISLPCGAHGPNGCQVYDDRPSVCRLYQCKLLKQYLAQEISWEKAEAIVNETREYAARLRAKLIAAKAETKPNGVGLQELIWDYFPANVANAETIESTPSDPVMPLFITFDYLLNRYFHGHVVQDIVDDE